MVLLQKLPRKQVTTVSDNLSVNIASGTSRVFFFTTDYYLNWSVQTMERDRRSTYGTIRIKVMKKEQVAAKLMIMIVIKNFMNRLLQIMIIIVELMVVSTHQKKVTVKKILLTRTIGNSLRYVLGRTLITSFCNPDLIYY